MIQDRLVAVIVRAVGFLSTLYGLLLHMGIFQGVFHTGSLMYYTIQSNLLALLLFGMLLVRSIVGLLRDGRRGSAGYYPRFEMVCVIDLLLTLLVYWILLAPGAFSMGDGYSLFSYGNLAVHLIAPLFCLVDYLLFAQPGHLRYKDVYAVIVYPLCYVVFTSICGLLGYVYRTGTDGAPVRFPYFFFDYDRIGWQSLLYIGALVVFFLLLAHGLYLLDKKRAKNAMRRAAPAQ